ncbi:MAG: DUF3568 family protein [Smithellaceae bacterium]|nr:DUF3568 family protein [Smithellaceae bacterium]
MKKLVAVSLCVGGLLIAACDGALTVAGRSIGVQSGKFLFTDGFVQENYPHPFERAWAASERATTDLKVLGVEKSQRIGAGRITGMIKDEPVTILVRYVSKEETAVSVRVGIAGNNLAAQLILERIAGNF